jgi:2-methylcitrate dehydratase PrpD
MSGCDIEAAFAAHAVRTRFADLPPVAVAKAKTFLLDTLGVGIAGRTGAHAEAIARLAAAWGKGQEATCWLDGARLAAGSAAVVNAYLIHCLEFDCVHEGAVVHPMATLVSALLAWAEREGTRGRPVEGARFLTALAVGVDVATLIGIATDSPVRFFRPATAGGFGAVAAIAHLAGFDEETTRSAFGHMYGQTSGTLQPHLEGSPLLGLQIGFNARGAIAAADLAASGIPGPRQALSGRYGYFALMESGSCHPERIAERLGREWQIARLAHKPYPSGRLTHGVIHGLRLLMAVHGFTAAEVERVRVLAPPLVVRLVGRPLLPAPAANYAKLCLPFVAGVYLAKGRCDLADFVGEALRDPAVHAEAAKVEVLADGNPDENALSPQRIGVRLRSGAEHEVLLPVVVGHPDAPLSPAENEEKFFRCAAHGGMPEQQARMLRDLVAQCEVLADVRQLVRALTPEAEGG